jgi:hypothetical protein
MYNLAESVEDKLDGDHFVASCKIVNNKTTIQTHALIDTGCSGFAFIDETFARHNNLPFLSLKSPRTLEVIDGWPISSGQITHLCYLPVRDAYQTTRVHYAELRVRLTATKVEVSKVSSVDVEYESP